MSDRYLPFSSDDLERDMQDRQRCRVCGRTCSSTVGVCRSPVCTSALVERLEQQLAEIREAAQPQQFDAVWKKYCDLEQIDPDNASGISEIGASFIYMAGFSEGKHPQYALEAELAELVAERDSLRDLVKKSQDEVVSFVPMLVELAALREAAGELVANAEWDGDISTVDTGDLKALRAELLQETPHD